MAGNRPPPATWPQATVAPRNRPPILRYVLLTVVGIVVAVGVAVLIIWLIIKPAPLEYTVEDVKIKGFNLTADGRLNATFDLELMADNRNQKVAVYYDSMLVEVLYRDRTVASKEVRPFFQSTRNATRILVEVVASETELGKEEARELRRDRKAGKVELEVKVKARLRFKVAELKAKHYSLTAYCTMVTVHFHKKGEFERAYCDVNIRR